MVTSSREKSPVREMSTHKPRSRSLDQNELQESGVRLLRLRLARRLHDGPKSPHHHHGSGGGFLGTSWQDGKHHKSPAVAFYNAAKNLLRSPHRTPKNLSPEPGGTKEEEGSPWKYGSAWVNQEALVNEVVSVPYRKRSTSMQYSPVSTPPRNSPQLLPCHRHPEYYQAHGRAHKLTLDLQQGQSSQSVKPTKLQEEVFARLDSRTTLGCTPDQPKYSPATPDQPKQSRATFHHPKHSPATPGDVSTTTELPDDSTSDSTTEHEHEREHVVLPGFTPTSYVVDGVVQKFYSSEEWRRALKAEEWRAQKAEEQRASEAGGVGGEGGRSGPASCTIHPYHHHHHNCSEALACDEEIRALLRLTHLTPALTPVPPPPPPPPPAPLHRGAAAAALPAVPEPGEDIFANTTTILQYSATPPGPLTHHHRRGSCEDYTSSSPSEVSCLYSGLLCCPPHHTTPDLHYSYHHHCVPTSPQYHHSTTRSVPPVHRHDRVCISLHTVKVLFVCFRQVDPWNMRR